MLAILVIYKTVNKLGSILTDFLNYTLYESLNEYYVWSFNYFEKKGRKKNNYFSD